MRDIGGPPIIRLEIEGMRQAMVVALSEYQVRLDAEVKASIDAYCTEDNIRRVVDAAVKRGIETSVQTAVEDFFSYSGPGRKMIVQAVFAKLNEGKFAPD